MKLPLTSNDTKPLRVGDRKWDLLHRELHVRFKEIPDLPGKPNAQQRICRSAGKSGIALGFFCGWCLVGEARSQHDELDYRTPNLEKYADLMEDPYTARYLRIFCDLSVHHGGAVFVAEKQREVDWLREQKDAGFPVLLEIFKREGDDFERGLPLKRRVLEYFFHFEGDKSGILEEVRRQLHTWVGKELSHDSHTPYVANSLELLAQVGLQQDLELIGDFFEDDDAMIRSDAKRQFATLKERLAKEKVNRDPGRTRKDLPARQPIGVTDGRVTGSPADSPRPWRWVIGTTIVLLTGCGYLLIKRTTSR